MVAATAQTGARRATTSYGSASLAAPWRQQRNNVRRVIERALSVLYIILHWERPGARSFAGLLSRITTRRLAATVSFVVWAFLPTFQN